MSDTVYVWDRFVRTFHWALVLLFVTSYITGEEEHWLHVYSGYAIATLVVLRILWGFTGSTHARFRDFVYAPGRVLEYLKALATGRKPARYLGHNPAGGMMVLVMLIALCCTAVSGMKLYAIEEGKGPFAVITAMAQSPQAGTGDESREHEAGSPDRDDGALEEVADSDSAEEEFWEEIHEFSVNLMLLLILLHLGGVFLSSRAHNESLLRAMITGRKTRT